MHVQAAPRAVEDEVLKLALEISLHLQELEPEHLRVDGEGMVPSTSSLCLVDEIIGFAACSAMVWTACSRISRSRRATAGILGEPADDQVLGCFDERWIELARRGVRPRE
jgi:hypothetical protein